MVYEEETLDPLGLMSQAERIIDKFNGRYNLARLIGKQPSTIYRWTYPRSKGGTGGLIPNKDLPLIRKAAREQGIYLTEKDLYPW